MFNCYVRFIWLKRGWARCAGLDGKASGVYCIMQTDAAGQIESQLDGPSGVLPRGIAASRLNLQVPAARGPQALELPCMPEALIGQRSTAIRGNLPAWHSVGSFKAGEVMLRQLVFLTPTEVYPDR